MFCWVGGGCGILQLRWSFHPRSCRCSRTDVLSWRWRWKHLHGGWSRSRNVDSWSSEVDFTTADAHRVSQRNSATFCLPRSSFSRCSPSYCFTPSDRLNCRDIFGLCAESGGGRQAESRRAKWQSCPHYNPGLKAGGECGYCSNSHQEKSQLTRSNGSKASFSGSCQYLHPIKNWFPPNHPPQALVRVWVPKTTITGWLPFLFMCVQNVFSLTGFSCFCVFPCRRQRWCSVFVTFPSRRRL